MAILFIVGFVAFGWAGVFLIRPVVWQRFGQNADHNEQVTFIVNVVGLFYGLLLGLVVVAAFQHYSDVQEKVSNEATALGVLYRDIAGLPDPLRSDLHAQLSDYNLYLINEVWPIQQRTGEVPFREVTAKVNAIQDKLVTFEPDGAAQTNSLYFSMQNLDEYITLRRDRLYEINNGLLDILYQVLLLGAALLIGASWFLSLPSWGTHLAVTGVIALSIGLFLFLIVALDYPLRSSIGISPRSFEVLQTTLIDPQ
jgi:hypothetical protein